MAAPVRIVGREAEMAAVRALVDGLPTGGVLLVEGEPGIGKSALLDVACARAEAAGAVTLRASADEFSVGRPFGLFTDGTGIRPATAGGQIDIDAVLGTLEERSGDRLLLLAFDDLQWADPLTLSMLAPFLRRLVPAGAAIVLAFRLWPRPIELEQLIDRIQAVRPVHLRLGPLSSAEVTALARVQLGKRIGPALADAMASVGGNPFYALSMLSSLDAEGRLHDDDGHVDIARGELAESLQRMLVQRVRLLGDDAARLLRTAALLGRTFDLAALGQLVDLAPTVVEQIIGRAIDAGVLGTSGTRLAFRHDLLREALEQDVALPLRLALHRRAVDVLVGLGAPVGDLAPHLLRADLRPSDVDLLVAASESTTPETATLLLERAVALLGDDDPRYATISARRVDSLVWAGRADEAIELGRSLLPRIEGELDSFSVFITIAHALFVLGRAGEAVDTWPWFPDTIDDVLRAGELGEASFASLFAGRLGQAKELAERARSLSDDPTSACIVATVLAWVAAAAGDLDTARREADRAVHEAPAAQETARRLGPHLVRAMVRTSMGDTDGALADIALDQSGADDLAAAVRIPFRHTVRANALLQRGEWDDALVEVEAGLAASDDLRVGAAETWLMSSAALLALARDGTAAASKVLARAGNSQLGSDQLVWVTGLVRQLDGDLAGAADLFHLVGQIGAAVGSRSSTLLVGPDLARAAVQLGDSERLDAAVTSTRWAEQSAHAVQRAMAAWTQGLAEADATTVADAASLLLADRPFDGARALHDAARLAAHIGTGQARDLAIEALATFDRLGATTFGNLLREDAGSFGVRLRAGRPTAARVGWEAVTATEREVLALLVEGLSNATIAERLIMSRRTVESHLAHVYTKVGISSRIELVRVLLSSDSWRAP